MKSQTTAQRYRHKAAECELNATKANQQIDQVAWSRLAEDWRKLARAEELSQSQANSAAPSSVSFT
jgi:hypothetical protein